MTVRDRAVSAPTAVVLAALAFVVSAAAVAIRHSGDLHPLSDIALTELAVRDVGHHWVLLGPYSRFGWNHPGPALFYALAAPYRALGSSSAALYSGAALLNGAMAALVVGVCARRGGRALAWWSLLVLGVWSWAVGPAVLRYPWNPYVTVLALAALVVLVWEMTAGRVWAMPVAFGVGTFLVQSHVGYAPITIVLVAVGTATLAGRSVARARAGPPVGRHLAIGAAVTVVVLGVLWAPPVVQQLTRDPGNLGELRLYFEHHTGEHSIDDGFDAVVPLLGVVPHQLEVRDQAAAMGRGAPGWASAATFAALALAALAAIRFRAWDGARLVALVAVSVPVAAISAARVTGEIYPYLVLWVAALGLVAWIAVGAVVVGIARSTGTSKGASARASRSGRTRIASAALASTVVLAVGVTGLNTADALRLDRPDAGVQPVGARIADRVTATARARGGDGPVLVRLGDRETWGLAAAAALALERHGVPVKVERNLGFLFGERMARDRRAPSAVLTVTTAGSAADTLERGRPGNRLLLTARLPDADRAVNFFWSGGKPDRRPGDR